MARYYFIPIGFLKHLRNFTYCKKIPLPRYSFNSRVSVAYHLVENYRGNLKLDFSFQFGFAGLFFFLFILKNLPHQTQTTLVLD